MNCFSLKATGYTDQFLDRSMLPPDERWNRSWSMSLPGGKTIRSGVSGWSEYRNQFLSCPSRFLILIPPEGKV